MLRMLAVPFPPAFTLAVFLLGSYELVRKVRFFYDLALSLCPGHGKEFRACFQVSV